MDTGGQLPGAEHDARYASAADVAALTARVYALELQLAAARGQVPRPAAAPPMLPPHAPPPLPNLPGQPPLAAARMPAAPKPPSKTLEERFGSQLFNMIGILALFIAASLALKLAIDNGWVNPTARVILGLAAGAGVILWSERFRAKGLVVFSWSMKAIGTGVLYLSLWAAFQLFHLLPAGVALGLMVLVTAWNAYLAWSQEAELLAAYALAGGFITPLLLASGGNHEAALFSYVLILDVGLVLLVRSRPWYRLLPAALGATVAYFIAWFAAFFPNLNVVTLSTMFWMSCGFVLLFFVTFEVVGWRGFLARPPVAAAEKQQPEGIVVPVLLPMMNALFVSLALYSVFIDSGLQPALPWLAVGLAAVYLALLRLQRTRVARALHLACAVVLLTAAVPLKTHGHALTITWLMEGLALFWISDRMRGGKEPELEAADTRDREVSRLVLEALAGLGFLLGLIALTTWLALFAGFSSPEQNIHFWNADLASALVAAATLGAAVWIAARSGRRPLAFAGLIAIVYVGLLLVLREAVGTEAGGLFHQAFMNGGFATELIGLAMVGLSARAAFGLKPAMAAAAAAQGQRPGGADLLGKAGMIVSNLTAIAIVVREIGAMYQGTYADASFELKRSLAVSAFLMAYGAGLLAVGFRQRSSFIRWQALILILFTILKVFLYDLSALSAGYRILSIFGLGALLMGVSLAYQKDWFGLRAAAPEAPAPLTGTPAPASEATTAPPPPEERP